MGKLYPYFGNSAAIVALQSSGAMPTALTLWTGSAGNCIKLASFVQGKSKAAVNANVTTYKTNDDATYDTKEEREGIVEGNIYERQESIATFFDSAIPTFKAAGRKFLVIFNLGIVSAKHKEMYAVGDISSEVIENDNNVEDCLALKFVSNPPSSALALTTTQLAAINTALGSGTVKGSGASKTIPASPTPRLIAYTTVS